MGHRPTTRPSLASHESRGPGAWRLALFYLLRGGPAEARQATPWWGSPAVDPPDSAMERVSGVPRVTVQLNPAVVVQPE